MVFDFIFAVMMKFDAKKDVPEISFEMQQKFHKKVKEQ